jgi:tetratricopeptide (TPR) repeat protein
MAGKKKDKKPIIESQELIVPEGIEVARIRDMANDFNIHHIRYNYGKHISDDSKAKRPHFAMFLGAGASKDSNLKLAWEMMEDFKKIILADEGLNFENDKEKAAWFDKQKWFSETKNKYSCLFQRAYKTDIDRRNYIEDVISEGEASLGYIILSNFIAENYVDTIITTNFDDLVYQACTSYTAVRPVVYSLGGFASEMSSMMERPKILKIHGDFLFSELKNTEDELAEQDPNMSKQVEEILAKYEGLIVIGYRGMDESVMNLLERLPRGHSLYWCEMSRLVDGKREIELDEKVIKLLKNKKGKLVEITGFDRLMKRILEVVNFDENIIVKAFEKRQSKLNEELHKFDDVTLSSSELLTKTKAKREESFIDKIDNVFDNLTLRNKASEEWRAKNYDEQERLARLMIKNNPKDYSGYFQLGLASREKGNNDEAEVNYRKSLELNPNFSMTYNNLGNVLSDDKDRLVESENMYRKSIELDTNNKLPYANLGILLSKDKNHWNQAEELFRKSIELDPTYAFAYFRLARLKSLQGEEKDKEDAFKYLKLAIENNPSLKTSANTNSDFDSIRDDPRFKEIVGD